jgi:hypothetical protein
MDVLEPRAGFRVSYVDEKQEDAALIDGIRFRSRVLSRNLDGVGRVFPFVLTVGPKLEEVIEGTGDALEKYLLDEIGNIALRECRRQFDQFLRDRFALGRLSFMAPGSLEDWPIEEQTALFTLLLDVGTALGIRLTESLLMLPRKSVSGIFFPSKVSFFSCQLCPRERCSGRKAKYDEAKAREFGVLKKSRGEE